MPVTDYNTWEAALHFRVHHGGLPGDLLRERTLKLTYVDRALQFDHIEWELNNKDGMLTKPEYLALGLVVSIKMGYLDGGTFPWKSFVVNRLRGGVGVADRQDAPVGENEAKIVYFGRNRNAPGGKTSRPWSKTAKAPKKKPGKIYPPTEEFKQRDMSFDSGKSKYVEGSSSSEVVRAIAARNGFEGASYAYIEDTDDTIDGLNLLQNTDDWSLVESLARKFKFICKIEGDAFHWHSPSWSGADSVVVEKFIYGACPDILSLDIDADFRLPIPLTTKASSYDFKNRQLLVGSQEYSKSTGKLRFGIMYEGLLNDPARSQVLTGVASGTTVGSLGTASQKAQAKFIASNWNAFQINLKVVGNPKLLATRQIEIGGTGSQLVDGRWYISEARHIRDLSGYTTEVKLKHPPKKSAGITRERTIAQNPNYDRSTGKLHVGETIWEVQRRPIKRLRK